MGTSARSFTVCRDGGSYGPQSGYGYLTVKDEKGHVLSFIGRRGVPDMNEKQAKAALEKQFPGSAVTVLPSPYDRK